MEFAEWAVSGLDRLRSEQSPAEDPLYQAIAAGLDGSSTLDAYLNGGDDAAHAALVQAIAQAAAENPAFEQQVRQAAESAQTTQPTQTAETTETTEATESPDATQSAEGNPGIGSAGSAEAGAGAAAGAAEAKPSFFKTTNGGLVLVAAAVLVVGGGVGLGVGLSGDSGSGGLSGVLQGAWTCKGFEGGSGSLTIGDGTWSAGAAKGTWKQDGSKVTITNQAHAGDDILITGAPSGAGPVNATLGSAKASADPAEIVHVTGSVAAHKLALTLQAPGGGNDASLAVTCTK